MNLSIIRRILGYVLILESALMLLPCVAALIYGEEEGMAYLLVAVLCLGCGAVLGWKKPANTVFYLKEGCAATALSWMMLSLFGCLPFLISGEIPRFTDALFETVSGFTTTGTTILNDVEAMSHAALLWRSLTHWIGGMGVLVFIMAIVPLSGGSNINLLRAESPGPSVGKLVPKMKTTARWLYVIYFALTLLEFIFLVAGKMPVFDAICTSIGTAGTGGFGVKNTSIGGYSTYIQWVVCVFMLLFGVNFNAYYFILFRQFKKAFCISEIWVYFATVGGAVAILFFNTYRLFSGVSEALCKAAFQTAAMVTSTGFTTTDYDKWPALSKTVIIFLMTMGACSGSTGGGIKVSRFMITIKSLYREILSYVHPKSVKKMKLNGAVLEENVMRSTNIYFLTFASIFLVSLFLISLEGYDFETNFTAVLSEMNNIGPGMNRSGPTESFYFFSNTSKFVFIFDMLAGRLELFPMLILFNPTLWKETISQRNHRLKRKLKK